MIGRKKLSTIRRELQCALAGEGDDPIRWLEQRMTAGRRGPPARGEIEVLQSLSRFLRTPGIKRRRTRASGGK